jgi:hypothetical protein
MIHSVSQTAEPSTADVPNSVYSAASSQQQQPSYHLYTTDASGCTVQQAVYTLSSHSTQPWPGGVTTSSSSSSTGAGSTGQLIHQLYQPQMSVWSYQETDHHQQLSYYSYDYASGHSQAKTESSAAAAPLLLQASGQTSLEDHRQGLPKLKLRKKIPLVYHLYVG